MGAGQSVEETADEDQGISFRVKSTDQQRQEYTSAGEEEFGSFHVLQVEDNSPAAGKLLPFLDFITAVNAKKLDHPSELLVHELQCNIGQVVRLTVFRSHLRKSVEIEVIPANRAGRGLLGVALRFCRSSGTLDYVYAVEDVAPGSPAEEAGLQDGIDVILGVPGVMLGSVRTLNHVLEGHHQRPLSLYVYSAATGLIRQVTVTPDRTAKMSLGCLVTAGAEKLYRLSPSDA